MYRRILAREAERIQSLYRRFPRKAVRKILGHKNEEYTGSINDLKEFTNPQDYSSSSQPYTHIHWNTLDTDDINMLSAPPTKLEIMKKLKKAKNTSPGKDKIGYLHLKLLDKKHYYLKQYSKLCTELEYLREYR